MNAPSCITGQNEGVLAMRFQRRSGLLRTQSLRLFALREPAAIAKGAA